MRLTNKAIYVIFLFDLILNFACGYNFDQLNKEVQVTDLEEIAEEELREVNKINPTLDESAPFKVYIPENLDECLIELKKMLHPKFVAKFKNESEIENIGHYHDGLGMWMRNNWGLWSGSRLAKHFNGIGIGHPDDMSGIILVSFKRHLKNQPLEIEKQVKLYKEYWKKMERDYPKPKNDE